MPRGQAADDGDMEEGAREAHLRIAFDGERIAGELRDEDGAVSAFSGWLDLLSALDSLGTPAADRAPPAPDMSASPEEDAR